ncbi:MAG: hypothetical protein MR589_06160 [Lachnobacterium sp.]|nr:hypothetical protein [Lachnobacterium sp.]
MAIKPIIESMITKANETTGKSDADLTVAMQSLIDGYGQGGSSGGGLPDTIIAGDTPIIASNVMVKTIADSNITATGIKIVVPKTGTYRFKFACGRTNLTGDWTTQLYKNGVAISGAVSTWSSYEGYCIADVSCDSEDEIEIYAQSRGTNYRNIIGQLVACID